LSTSSRWSSKPSGNTGGRLGKTGGTHTPHTPTQQFHRGRQAPGSWPFRPAKLLRRVGLICSPQTTWNTIGRLSPLGRHTSPASLPRCVSGGDHAAGKRLHAADAVQESVSRLSFLIWERCRFLLFTFPACLRVFLAAFFAAFTAAFITAFFSFLDLLLFLDIDRLHGGRWIGLSYKRTVG
jgi:hypothetical protein